MSIKKQSNVWVLGGVLGLIGAVSACLLAICAEMTKTPIKDAEQAKTNAALKKVLPAFDNQPSEDKIEIDGADGIPVTYYRATKDGELVGLAGESYSPKGYAGKVWAMVGLNPDGKIRTVIIVKQNETPGLGTVVCDRKREVTINDLIDDAPAPTGLPPNPILDQFDGHAADKADPWGAGPWKVEKDGGKVEAITGATISSRAVTDAVYHIARTYIENKAKIDAGGASQARGDGGGE